jgi:hypothetical protein
MENIGHFILAMIGAFLLGGLQAVCLFLYIQKLIDKKCEEIERTSNRK